MEMYGSMGFAKMRAMATTVSHRLRETTAALIDERELSIAGLKAKWSISGFTRRLYESAATSKLIKYAVCRGARPFADHARSQTCL